MQFVMTSFKLISPQSRPYYTHSSLLEMDKRIDDFIADHGMMISFDQYSTIVEENITSVDCSEHEMFREICNKRYLSDKAVLSTSYDNEFLNADDIFPSYLTILEKLPERLWICYDKQLYEYNKQIFENIHDKQI